MESNKSNPPDERTHDEALARRMRMALERDSVRGEANCPDAERIAAYQERSLSLDEIAQCENHFAVCPRCRQIVSMLAATLDQPSAELEPAPVSELAKAVSPASKPEPPVSNRQEPKRWDWRVRWLAPALGLAAVLAMWFAIRPPWNSGPGETLVAQAPSNEVGPATALPLPAPAATANEPNPQGLAKNSTDLAGEPSLAIKQTSSPPVDALAKARAGSGPVTVENKPGPGADDKSLRDERQAPLAANRVEQRDFQSGVASGAPAIAPPAAPPPPTAAQPPSPQPSAAANEAPRSTSQSVVVTEEAPQVEAQQKAAANGGGIRPATDLPLNGRNYSNFGLTSEPGRFAVQIKPLAGNTQWRAGIGGAIQRSNDAGRTWTTLTSPSQQDWLAGAAVSDRLGWLVGRKGAIARTIDGEHWVLLPPPALSGTPPDWIGVTATDAQNATITSADQHQFVTQDGAKTWRMK